MSAMAVPSLGNPSRKRKHEGDLAVPARKSRRSSEEQISASDGRVRDNDSPRLTNTHTKKERKQNRSTRIHSLRKQLARGGLPSTIQQEKERELAALLHEQAKTKAKQEARKTLEKYHYVRFVERQKAEKRLKQLRKQLQTEPEDDSLSRQIYDMEVNRNYAIYAPLDQKYISIFASGSGKTEHEHDDLPGRAKSRPPMWNIVAETMPRGQSALEALRDGRSRSTVAGEGQDTDFDKEETKSSTKRNKLEAKGLPREGGRLIKKETQIEEQVGQSADDDMSDGGFFDR